MKRVILLLLLPAIVFSEQVLPAKEAREQIELTIYNKHKAAIDWWIGYINAAILKESKKPNASLTIEITTASIEVGSYLEWMYETAGYKVELIPGWNKTKNIPDGTTYLCLLW